MTGLLFENIITVNHFLKSKKDKKLYDKSVIFKSSLIYKVFISETMDILKIVSERELNKLIYGKRKLQNLYSDIILS